jgi:CheY-like chemotaxis protein
MPPDSADALSGPCVCLQVSDTGAGMPPGVLARVFEPFFTTKEVGKGTGLGLSQVYGFVRQSNGHITVDSRLGAGTTFRMYLPRASETEETARPDVALGVAAVGSETVLVVEDNDDVRAMAVALLHEFGYRVLTAADAPAALEILKRHSVDLLFSDVVMPGGMDGYELVRQAREVNARVKALLTSGYTQRHSLDTHDAAIPLLAKPYKPAQLAATLREVLDHS